MDSEAVPETRHGIVPMWIVAVGTSRAMSTLLSDQKKSEEKEKNMVSQLMNGIDYRGNNK